MHTSKYKNHRLYFTLALMGLLILFGWSRLVEAMPLTAKQHLEQAWRTAADVGRFEYQTSVEQTIRPTARLENAGRHPTRQQIRAEGWVNRPDNAMQLRLWSSQTGQHGIELKVEGEKAYGRLGAEEAWTEIPNPTDIFAPGGDPLGFLVAAENVQVGGGDQGLEGRELTLDEVMANPQLANPDSQFSSANSYTFDLNGPRYAGYMRDQMEAAMRERGELPPGITLDLARQFAEMSGHGEIWLNADGLPIRQVIHLEFPAEQGALDRMDADITTTFGGWESASRGPGLGLLVRRAWEDPKPLVQQFLSSKTLQEISMALGTSLLFAALALMAFTHRKSRKFYGAVTLSLIVIMVVTPLLQSHHVYAFTTRQQQRRAEFEQQQTASQQSADARAALESDFNPTINPLEDRNQESDSLIPNPYSLIPNSQALASSSQAAATTATCYDDVDSDGDGLSDHVECYKTGTLTDTIDSDMDGISDLTEVKGFVRHTRWYLDPLNPDSNGDGFSDAIECPALVDVDEFGNKSNPLGNSCVDTDDDWTPDVFDFDNDGDLVPDRVDISPNYNGSLATELQDTFNLALGGYDDITDRTIVVEFQLRPPDPAHLFQTNNVLDWPGGDTQGQITRVKDNTLADMGYIGSRTDQGDILLAPMLEIKIPDPADNPDNPSGGLPVKVGFGGTISGDNLDDWLDTDALDQYSIIVSQDTSDNTLVVYLPLSTVEDTTGNTPVAWGTQMMYRPGNAPWGDAHQVRMVWLVQMLVDACDTSGMAKDDTYQVWCRADSDHWVTDFQVVQTYYEDFTLTGLTVREDYGLELAVMAQSDALTVDYENYLWHLSNALQTTFGAGQLVDTDNRFDLAEIVNRFGGDSGTEWDIPIDKIVLNTAVYTDQVNGLSGMVYNQIPDILSDTYGSAVHGDAVTLLFAREETYRATSLQSATYNDADGVLTLSLSGLPQQTYATVHWSPYEYDDSGEWLSMDLYDYTDTLEDNLTNAISDDEIIEMLGWFGETAQDNIATLKQGAVGQARNYYTALYQGNSQWVYGSESGNINSEIVDDAVHTLDFDGVGGPDEAVLVIVAAGLGLMQVFFQREGDLVLDEVCEILLTLGVMEEELDEQGESLIQTGVVGTISLAKSLMKKLIKRFYKVKGAVKYYQHRKYVTRTTTSLVVISGLLAAANTLFYNSKNQRLEVASTTLDLAAEVLDAGDEVYTYYRAAQGFGSDDIMVNYLTMKKLEKSTRVSAVIGLVAEVAIAATIFAFSIKNAPPGSFAFNAALALFIAQVIVAVISAIIASTLIGSLILAIVGLIDAVIMAICKWNGARESQAVKTWVCGGITGAVTQAIVYAIYDQHVLVDLGRSDRMTIGLDTPTLIKFTDTDGYVQGNAVDVSAIVTSTLKLNEPPKGKIIANSFSNSDLKRKMRGSTFAYELQTSRSDIHEDLQKHAIDWGTDNTESFTVSERVSLDQAGINRNLTLYLAEGFKIVALECWGFIGATKGTCDEETFGGSSHIYLGDGLILDVLPDTFAGFVNMTESENHSYRPSWSDRFPTQIDADGDGLRSKASGGPDPDDSTWDLDGDGLSDFWELDNGFDPALADGDNDGLADYWEAFYDTNPRKADSDGDGLPDGDEFYHSRRRHPYDDALGVWNWTGGWDITYGYYRGQPQKTWVSADPLAYDTDADTLSDNRERIYGYNPNIPSVLNILTLDTEIDASAVRPGGSIGYTATIKNELDGRILNGLLQAEFPIDVVQSTEVMDTLYPLDTITMTGGVNAPLVTESQVTSLTIRAGVVISAPTLLDEPPGPVFFLKEHRNSQDYRDDSGNRHPVQCVNDDFKRCPDWDRLGFIGNGFNFTARWTQLTILGNMHNGTLYLGANDNTFSTLVSGKI